MAARMPAQPAPTTRTSCFASTKGDAIAGVERRASLRSVSAEAESRAVEVVANRTEQPRRIFFRAGSRHRADEPDRSAGFDFPRAAARSYDRSRVEDDGRSPDPFQLAG